MKKFLIIITLIITICGLVFFYLSTRITFSIIIPVYNAEKYLPRCLDSVFAQDGTYEVIAINDGSTDSSLSVLQKYASKYSNMKIINQKNKGVSVARNTGITASKNKYITFIDSDDWAEPNMLSYAKEIIEKDKPDIVLSSFYDVYDHEWVRQTKGEEYVKDVVAENRFRNRNLDKLQLFSPFYGKDAHSDLFYIGGGVRARFFRKSFIDKYALNFPDNINIHEDDVFLFRAFLNNPLISITTKAFYNYRNRADSLSKSPKVLESMGDSLACMQNTAEFRNAGRRTKMLIEDSWLSLTILGVSNALRNDSITEKGINETKKAYEYFATYNKEEQKSCRNFQKLKRLLNPKAY